MHPVVRAILQAGASFVRFGRAYLDGAGDYLSALSSSDFYLFNSPYCIEFIINFPSVSGVQVIAEQFTAPSGPGWTVYRTGTKVAIYRGAELQNTTALSTNTDYHIAFTGNGSGSTKVFIDGTQDGTTTGLNSTNSASALYIGARSGSANFLNAYVKGIRITLSERYTSNFTKPDHFEVDSANVKLCMNFAEAIGATTFIDECGKTITTNGNVVIVA